MPPKKRNYVGASGVKKGGLEKGEEIEYPGAFTVGKNQTCVRYVKALAPTGGPG